MTQAEAPKPRPRRGRRERGVLLTLWIGLIALLGLAAVASVIIPALNGQPQAAPILSIVTALFLLLFAWGLWQWQRWAYFALLIVFAVALAVVLIAYVTAPGANLLSLIAALVLLAGTIALIQPRLDEFR